MRHRTSSPGSEGGPSPSELPGGPTTALSGLVPVHASPSPLPGSGAGQMTLATFGPSGSGSFASVTLTRSLANRLRAVTDLLGSTLFRMTWKVVATPSGRLLPRLAASGRRTSDSDFTSWPTPVSNDDNKTPAAHLAMKKRMGERDGTGANRTAITSLAVSAQIGLVANASDRDNGAGETWGRRAGLTDGGELGDSEGREGRSRHDIRKGQSDLGAPGVLVNASGEQARNAGQPRERAGTVGDTGIAGLAGRPSQPGDDGEERQTVERAGGPSNGFWADAEWLPCTDGKARPTQSGLFPLAHGVPSRVGRLRAYGNALVIPQAAEFVKAHMAILQ